MPKNERVHPVRTHMFPGGGEELVQLVGRLQLPLTATNKWDPISVCNSNRQQVMSHTTGRSCHVEEGHVMWRKVM